MRVPVFETSLGRLFQGDCIDVLSTVDSNSVDLVFADPPFNLGKDYGKTVSDSLHESDYLEVRPERGYRRSVPSE